MSLSMDSMITRTSIGDLETIAVRTMKRSKRQEAHTVIFALVVVANLPAHREVEHQARQAGDLQARLATARMVGLATDHPMAVFER